MKRFALLTIFAVLGLPANCPAQTGTVAHASALELKGQFEEAAHWLSKSLMADDSLSSAQRKQIEFELDRLDRIKKDFPFTKDSLFGELKKSVKNLTAEEYNQWIEEGRFDSREIDGKQFF